MFHREKNKSTYLNDSRCLTGRSLVYSSGPAGKENQDHSQIPLSTESDVMLSAAFHLSLTRGQNQYECLLFRH